MVDGACGLSTGLIYAPGSYAETAEIVEIAKGAGAAGGFYASHIRGEGATLLDAVAEAIRVGREGRLPVQVSHIKAAGRAHWGRVGDALALIDGARAEGLDVMADVYPYTASSTTIRTLLPDWVLEGGIEAMLGRLRDPATRGRIQADMATGPVLARGLEWSDIMIASAPSHAEIEGLRLDEIARSWGKDPVEATFDVIQSEKGRGNIILFQLDEADLRRALVHPRVMIGSDGSSLATSGPMADGKPHPRSYGTFPRVLGRYARDERVLPLETAVHKMTGMPAARLGLSDRGLVREGCAADLVVFDPRTVRDEATFAEPHRYPTGIPYVIVNGDVVVDAGRFRAAGGGRVLTPR